MFLKRVYTGYAFVVFVLTYLLIFPLYFIFGLKEEWHRHAYRLSHYWAIVYFPLIFIKKEVEIRGKKQPSDPCIVCANHFSYLDIATLPLLPVHGCFVGKSSISKIPLFGYMFKTQHIMVNRNSVRDKAKTVIRSKNAIENGKSLYVFPEGGIKTTNPPMQDSYHDGAFRTAIETQVDLLPVTIAFNWLVLPDDGKMILRSRHIKLIQHEPIPTRGLNMSDLHALKEKVFKIISEELSIQNNEN